MIRKNTNIIQNLKHKIDIIITKFIKVIVLDKTVPLLEEIKLKAESGFVIRRIVTSDNSDIIVSQNDIILYSGKSGRIKLNNVQKNEPIIIKANNLIELDIRNNFTIVEIDITKAKNLQNLYCYGNKITELDISKNPKLINIICNDNEINNLIITTNNKQLNRLDCSNNKLSFSKVKDIINNLPIKNKNYSEANFIGNDFSNEDYKYVYSTEFINLKEKIRIEKKWIIKIY